MLYGWVRQLKAEADDAFRGNGKLTAQDEEIRRLRRENAGPARRAGHFKKNGGLVREALPMRYAFIQEHIGTWKLCNLFRALNVSKSAFFAWRKRPPSERETATDGDTVLWRCRFEADGLSDFRNSGGILEFRAFIPAIRGSATLRVGLKNGQLTA